MIIIVINRIGELRFFENEHPANNKDYLLFQNKPQLPLAVHFHNRRKLFEVIGGERYQFVRETQNNLAWENQGESNLVHFDRTRNVGP